MGPLIWQKMRPKSHVPQRALLGFELREMLNPDHPLYVLALFEWLEAVLNFNSPLKRPSPSS